MEKKKIGILYITTGKYVIFWKAFYESFEKYFLPHMERHYFVFTDACEDEIKESQYVHVYREKQLPWPLPTLLKYHYFLQVEEELKQMDYLYQSNGPVVCEDYVDEEGFLPREEFGETLMFTRHPGFYQKPRIFIPYERNPRSKAYVPYNQGKCYVFGAMNGGKSDAYLSFMKELRQRITDDLNHNLIARFHDESHVNHGILFQENYRIIDMAYAYPSNAEIPTKRIICLLDKSKYFDVDELKGMKVQKKGMAEFLIRAFRYGWNQVIIAFVKLIRDTLFRKKATND